MIDAHSISNNADRSILIMFLSALVVTLFLFYIDEGFYNLNWMTDLGNWVAFGIYISLIFCSQFVVYQLFSWYKVSKRKLGWSIVMGTGLALLLAFFVIF
jgi:hypothetical protein